MERGSTGPSLSSACGKGRQVVETSKSLLVHVSTHIGTNFLNVKNVFGSGSGSVDDVKKLVWSTFDLMSIVLHW